MTVSGDVLPPRALLARQLLLERVDRPVLEVVEHLVGPQGQEPRDPHVALWSRLASTHSLSVDAQEAVADEGDRLLVFLDGPGDAPADRDVRLLALR